jgi:hypothetical protein
MARQTQLDANDLSGRLNLWRGNGDDHVQPPHTIAQGQVGGVSRVARVFDAVIRNMKADCLPPANK